MRFADGIDCAYGENGWQAPARLVPGNGDDPLALHRFELVEGSAPSFNNLAEIDRQLQTVTHIAAAFDGTGDLSAEASAGGAGVGCIAVGTKHGNACGAAVAGDPVAALQGMLVGDLRAIFGGVVMVNFPVGAAEAAVLLEYETPVRRLLDVVLAPSFSEGAVQALARKHGKCRLIANPALGSLDRGSLDGALRRRQVRGGVLEQPGYTFVLELESAECFGGPLSDGQRRDLLLAWAVGSTSNSNTITLVREGRLIGNGVGQQDRVSGCQLAIQRAVAAGHETAGCVAYSDSFFPFPDGPQVLIDAGASAVFATSGSVRDEEVRQTFVDAGVALVQLPDSAARGFYGH